MDPTANRGFGLVASTALRIVAATMLLASHAHPRGARGTVHLTTPQDRAPG